MCTLAALSAEEEMMIKNSLRALFAGAVLSAVIRAQAPTPVPTGKENPPRLAVPVEPIAAIVEAFRSHTIVALGNVEFRGNEQCHALQLSLIRAPGLTAAVNDIVVEFGN